MKRFPHIAGDVAGGRLQKLIFVSSTESAGSQTDAHCDSLSDLVTELQQLGQAAATPGSPALAASPYSTRLRPVTRLSHVIGQTAVLTRAEFVAIDTTLWDGAAAGTGQDAATVQAIEDSLSNEGDAYVMSRFRNGIAGSWQPNFFRPSLRINGTPQVFGVLGQSQFGNHANPADLAWGLPLPYCDDNLWIDCGHLDSIEVYAQAGQYIAGTSKVQRYPVLCYLDFYVYHNTIGDS